MKNYEKVFLWLIPLVLLGIFYNIFYSYFFKAYMDANLEEVVSSFYPFFLLISLLSKNLIINSIIAIWLFYISKNNTKWTWALVGLIFGFYGIIFYFIVVLFNDDDNHIFNDRNINLLRRFLTPLLIIVPLSYIFALVLTTIPTDTRLYELINDYFGNKRFSWAALSFTAIKFFIDISVAVWLYTIARKASRISWLWSVFIFFKGMMPLIIFSLLYLSDYRLLKLNNGTENELTKQIKLT